jgi:hypothetical protein
MGQEEIIGFLKRNRADWFTSSQIVNAVKVSRPSVNRCLVRMRKHSEVNEKMERVWLKGKLGFISKEVPFYSFKKN